MAIKVGEKVTGKVSGITNFGAFIDLGDHKTGLVHISEVSDGYVKDIHDILSVGDEVTVKVLSIGDDGKIGLSIRKASDHPGEGSHSHHGEHNHDEHSHHGHANNGNHGHRGGHDNRNGHKGKNESFDDLLSDFMKESESRMSVIKKNTEGKRGGRGGRRS
ncbi:S1 domain-containing RNA-binding protein [Fructilactobacillus fructivorans]|uniref:RNA binding protein, contains ribosomal protein S1 domain n=1 Tax=Fructilactobacillus fructivorans TaxID=1614 RepID=A0A0C1PJY0_9LACO|nr:S1 domain-containing RNA-binding protein [Fructilactobacillus fructivorans]KID41027.1 RNA binding protein, contains ribosomal protein S1 domain [Fructilactobacillus fructivorans]KRK57363.1 hypothetical protein FC73_GL000908 [Fructilactobacillus fructivorans]KRN12490.1 hypothetical protein IV37_GL001267 [Fructilactobacillus fructivorans]KRN41014.1 hypothetical protein IV51_GL000759 [Fructilactobacillus fructivorans]KRN42999.1 hypothetical protein IV48_GL001027 [Fructilactobacillus fructivora